MLLAGIHIKLSNSNESGFVAYHLLSPNETCDPAIEKKAMQLKLNMLNTQQPSA
jgi:hypothetical protein